MVSPRHGGRTPAVTGSTSRRGFRARALVAGGALAMTAGLALAAALDGDPLAPVVASAPGSDRVLTVSADGAPRDADERETPPPAPLPDAVAAVPALIDATVVDAAGLTFADRNAGLRSAAVPSSAGGDLVVVPGNVPAPLTDRPVRTVRVEVEAGLDVDGEVFAAMVLATLNDQRSWGGDGSMTFARTDGEDQDLRVVLASPDTVDAMCAPLNTHGDYSCGRYGHAAINYTRWLQATEEFVDMTVYRQYVINHEVGHLLGHQHTSCTGSGDLAPIMQQQSIEVAPCLPNAWPFPVS